MSSTIDRESTYYKTFTQAIAANATPGDTITIDNIRAELEYAQIPPTMYGPLFAAACHRGVLMGMNQVQKSVHPSAKGRRVLVYYVRHTPPVVDVDLFGNAA